jgi:acyl-CoA oxidase
VIKEASVDLASFVRGGISDDFAARLHKAIPPGFFGYPDGLALLDRCAITYERLRHAGLAVPPAGDLLAEPPELCALLERAAAADPALFHLMLLHYTLVLAPIVRYGGEAAGPARRRLESLQAFGVVGMTEAGRSNSHLAPQTIARFEPETRSFVLTTPDAAATKFPTSSGHPRLPKTAVVYAQLIADGQNRGVFIFVVPLRDDAGTVAQGVQITPAPDGQHLAIDHAAVRFAGARVPFEAWLASGAEIAADGSFTDPSSQQRLALAMATTPHVWRGVISACAAITRASAACLAAHNAGRVAMGGLAPGRCSASEASRKRCSPRWPAPMP